MNKPITNLRRVLHARDFQTLAEKRIKAEILENAQKLNNASRANSKQYADAISRLLLDLVVAELAPQTCDKCGAEVHP